MLQTHLKSSIAHLTQCPTGFDEIESADELNSVLFVMQKSATANQSNSLPKLSAERLSNQLLRIEDSKRQSVLAGIDWLLQENYLSIEGVDGNNANLADWAYHKAQQHQKQIDNLTAEKKHFEAQAKQRAKQIKHLESMIAKLKETF